MLLNDTLLNDSYTYDMPSSPIYLAYILNNFCQYIDMIRKINTAGYVSNYVTLEVNFILTTVQET